MNCGVFYVVEKMERETRIELATNSLEGCDSTIELLPLLISIIPLRAFTAVRTGRFRFRLRSQSLIWHVEAVSNSQFS